MIDNTGVLWRKCKWGNLAILVYGKALRDYNEIDGIYPVYGTNGQIGWHTQPLCDKPGIIIGRKGAYRGVHYSDKPFFVIDTAFYLKPTNQSFDIKWAYYQLLNFNINNLDSGSAIPSTSREAFYEIAVDLPPLESQRKIASILSAYDDLIENNTRRIKILEEMAQALYREWFVKFRFPGHKKARMVESELGMIPEGWEIKHLPDMCSKVIDGTHDTPKPVNEGYYLVTGKHIINGFIDFSNCYFISQEEHERVIKRSKPEKGDIIFSNIGTLGSATLVDQDFEFSIKNVALFKPKIEIYSSFLYLYFSSPETLNIMLKKASGTSQKFFSLDFLRSMELVVSTDTIISHFDSIVRPLLEERSLLNKKNQNLRRTRDLLLPKLISGEVNMENIEVQMPNNGSGGA